jgi:hypothetical protein
MNATATESDLERTVREEQEAHDRQVEEGNAKGKLIEVPRVAVVVDESDPNILKLAFTGGVDGERGDHDWVSFFNSLTEGKNHDIAISVFVKGSKKTHRRDSDGNVDAVVQTKTLLVHSIDYDQ